MRFYPPPLCRQNSKWPAVECKHSKRPNFAVLHEPVWLMMSTARNTSTGSGQPPAEDINQWTKHLPYLFTITLPQIKVRQTTHEVEKTKDTKLLLITRSDGIHKIGYLPNEEKDTRLGDGTEARQAYLCKLGSILAAKAGISNGGNKPNNSVWDALPEVVFGYEVFERARDRAASNRAGDLYVVGHPIDVGALFRTPEEFAQHLWWLAEGDEEKECVCVLCQKELKRKAGKGASGGNGDIAVAWRQDCHDRAKSYLSSTTLGSFWGDLPELSGNRQNPQHHND